MTVHRVDPGQEIPIPDQGDTIQLGAGFYYGNVILARGVTLEGEPGAVLSAATTRTLEWRKENDWYWSTDVGFQPAILAVNGQQVMQWHPDYMTKPRDKNFRVTGFEALSKPNPWILGKPDVEWNGEGNFWEAIKGLWGYFQGRVYLRLVDGSDPNTIPIEAAPRDVGLILQGNNTIKDLELRLFSQAVVFDGTDSNVLDSVSLRCFVEGLTFDSGCQSNRVINCDISPDIYADVPGAWQGGNAVGEIFYRLGKYIITGASSSGHKAIVLKRPGDANEILHNWIHDGILGIQFSSQGTGKVTVAHNIFERNNSIGMAVVEADQIEAFNNRWGDNNIHVRLQDLGRAGKRWTGSWYDNVMSNPQGLGGAFFGHTFNGQKPVGTITANIYNNTITGGRARLSFPNGTLNGRQENNTTGARPGLYPEPGPDYEDQLPEEEMAQVKLNTSHTVDNSGAEGDILVEWILRWGENGRRTLEEHKTTIAQGGTVLLMRSFDLDLGTDLEHTLETRVEDTKFNHLASHSHTFTIERGEMQISISGSVEVAPAESF